MSREFPDWVDPWKAAEGKRCFQGTIPVVRMKRLLPLLAGKSKIRGDLVVGFQAQFDHDFERRVRIRIKVEAELPLICQRSLEPYNEPVRRSSELSVIRSLDEQELLPDHSETLLVESQGLALTDLVEEELLIGLPQIPRNPGVRAVNHSTGADPMSEVPPTVH